MLYHWLFIIFHKIIDLASAPSICDVALLPLIKTSSSFLPLRLPRVYTYSTVFNVYWRPHQSSLLSHDGSIVFTFVNSNTTSAIILMMVLHVHTVESYVLGLIIVSDHNRGKTAAPSPSQAVLISYLIGPLVWSFIISEISVGHGSSKRGSPCAS